jgi:adenylate cyclase
VDNLKHALDAAHTGFQMQAGLEALNAGREARGLPALRMGIGILTCTVFAGNVGSAQRTKYTVGDDTVNVAARMEGLNKDLRTTLLTTGDTYAAVLNHVNVKDRGKMKVKGRQQAVTVCEILALAEDAGSFKRRS